MSGILNNKERVLDVILTDEGRRQMAKDTFKVVYATFTDAGVSYSEDLAEGHEDPTNKIYLEACNLPQDQITFEADDSGKLVPFRNSDLTTDINSDPHHATSRVSSNLTGGKLTSFEYHHGRIIEADDVEGRVEDNGKGFYYSDYSGVTGSIYVSTLLKGGTVAYSSPSSGAPYKATIGIKDGIPSNIFASCIDSCIKKIKDDGGPVVESLVKENIVYLDVGNSLFGNQLSRIGDDIYYPLKLTSTVVGGNLISTELKDEDFANQITNIFKSSFDNFKKLQTLSSVSSLNNDEDFELSENNITFNGNNIERSVYTSLRLSTPSINSEVESLFFDEKLSHLDNFKYLPPILKPKVEALPVQDIISQNAAENSETLNVKLLGSYPPWGNNVSELSFSEIQNQLNVFEKNKVYFQRTSTANNVICQFFEVKNGQVSKLDVIEFGSQNGKNEMNENNKIYFVGKTYLDDRGTQCFINMFTLVFNLNDRNFE